MGEANRIFFAVMAELKRGQKEPVALFLDESEAKHWDTDSDADIRRVRVSWEELDKHREQMIQEIKDATDRLIEKRVREAGSKGLTFDELAQSLLSGLSEREITDSIRRLENTDSIHREECGSSLGGGHTFVHKDMK